MVVLYSNIYFHTINGHTSISGPSLSVKWLCHLFCRRKFSLPQITHRLQTAIIELGMVIAIIWYDWKITGLGDLNFSSDSWVNYLFCWASVFFVFNENNNIFPSYLTELLSGLNEIIYMKKYENYKFQMPSSSVYTF